MAKCVLKLNWSFWQQKMVNNHNLWEVLLLGYSYMSYLMKKFICDKVLLLF